MANFHPQSTFLTLEAEDRGKLAPSPLHLLMHQQPHLGVEMEDDTSGDTSDDNAKPPLPIPPPLTDLVPPIE
ncbi:hypothetical protein PAXRUDRAFT_13444 [Paxillus rubicundulus Ve08.2h10]|uniref:Uncharacterized protein n=1 Tax=Paxillus rubicundulus Ve08.2h10 TaxID=930991 RepID=A0A0D0DZ17_9AGAM|nr:hypothetical protein PAXRUDRAFT_13444 [Paxillus rubicundulus Ve08.2h10]